MFSYIMQIKKINIDTIFVSGPYAVSRNQPRTKSHILTPNLGQLLYELDGLFLFYACEGFACTCVLYYVYTPMDARKGVGDSTSSYRCL